MTKAEKTFPKYFTVGDLKKLLEPIPDNLPIGRSGHFGEFNHMDSYDFHITKAYPVPVNTSWRQACHIEPDIEIFSIISPDIGEDPD